MASRLLATFTLSVSRCTIVKVRPPRTASSVRNFPAAKAKR